MSKQASVAEASPSPPPLPKELLPSVSTGASSSKTPTPAEVDVDQPINTLGDDDEEESEEEWDPAAERLPGETSKSVKNKDKGKGKEQESDPGAGGGNGGSHPWQAVWSPEKNAWYFWNTTTGEVTWTNPLAPPTASSSSSTPSAPPLPPGPAPTALPIRPTKQGGVPDIDPDLAFLLPSESRYLSGGADAELQMANFNSRTGKFSANDATYAVDHLDEYNRQKRFNSHYFDQEKWEADMRERNLKRELEGAEGGSRKISKKDMDRFRKKKQEKRMRSQAWLRD